MKDLEYIVFESSGGKYRVKVLGVRKATLSNVVETEPIHGGPYDMVVGYVRSQDNRSLTLELAIGSIELIGTTTCPRCRGCGRIASGEEGAPWTDWETLPKESRTAVDMGLVFPIVCPECKGRGTKESDATTT